METDATIKDLFDDISNKKERDGARETKRETDKNRKRKRSTSPVRHRPGNADKASLKASTSGNQDEGCEPSDEFITKKQFSEFAAALTEQQEALFSNLSNHITRQLKSITSPRGSPMPKHTKHHHSHTDSNPAIDHTQPGHSRQTDSPSHCPELTHTMSSDNSDSESEDDARDPFRSLKDTMLQTSRPSALDDISSFFTEEEQWGDEVSEKVATAFKMALNGKGRKDELKNITNKHLTPKNIENLRVPKIKEEVWEFLPKRTIIRDSEDQKVVNLLVRSMSITARLLDMTFSAHSSNSSLDPKDMFELLADKTKIETATFNCVNEARRNKLKPFFKEQFKKICVKKSNSNEYLFGETLADDVKAIKETSSMMDNITGMTSSAGNGQRRGQSAPTLNFPARRYHKKKGTIASHKGGHQSYKSSNQKHKKSYHRNNKHNYQ